MQGQGYFMLLRAIKKAWEEIDTAISDAQVRDVGKRMKEIVDAEGTWVKHH
jgi:hypothetical protein